MPEARKVVELKRDGKYAIFVRGNATDAQMERIRNRFKEWYESSDPILLVSGDIELIPAEQIAEVLRG